MDRYTANLDDFWFSFITNFVHAYRFVPGSLFNFVHRSINFTIPFDNPTANRMTSRIDLINNHIFLWGVRYWVLKEPRHSMYTYDISTELSQLLLLRLDITHLYSKYSTPVKFGTKEPKLVMTFQSGKKVSSSGTIDLQGLTVMCSRSDRTQFQSIPFNVSIEFEEAITTLSTHVFNINATTLSATGIYTEFTQSFFDTMTVSISVGSGE